LPEIYRLRDTEQLPPGQLAAYLALVESAFGAIHDNIGELYRDHFIETCSPWAIPYIGDLLGVSVLSGTPWTLRADVADTIELRRRKGTIHGIELLAFDLTEWVAHCVELREILAWHQHLNHQRPDIQSSASIIPGVARGGYAAVRDPATLSLLGTPFDPFAHYPDLKNLEIGVLRPNLPALAIFLWRLAAYQAPVSLPVARGSQTLAPATPTGAGFAARFDMEPNGIPTVLFNTARVNPNADPPVLSTMDEVPGPIPAPRITEASPLGVPWDYVSIDTYDATAANLDSVQISNAGLQFHLPSADFAATGWTIRGANLCAWEAGLGPELRQNEIVIDPRNGRVVFGVQTSVEADALESSLLVSFTYGQVGPVGAQPVDTPLPAEWTAAAVEQRSVQFKMTTLQHALDNLDSAIGPVVITIEDSMTYELDLSSVAGATLEGTTWTLNLKYPLAIVAAPGTRPVIQLKRPLSFRPKDVVAGAGQTQTDVDALVANLHVRLQGLYITQEAASPAIPLIAQAAVERLEVVACTLDPGSALTLKPPATTAPISAMNLDAQFGFTDLTEYQTFKVTPHIVLQQSIAGPLLMESVYSLTLERSIVDAGAPPNVTPGASAIAIGSLADPVNGYGPPLSFQQLTVLGISRLRSASGAGGIFCHALEVWNNQVGCIRNSSFSSEANRLPQNFACVTGASYGFTANEWNQPGYAQLLLDSDDRILEDGPDNDEMGAFGFLLESHKWRNLSIRLRENMPAGSTVDIIPVT
jgi:hypothetical protein